MVIQLSGNNLRQVVHTDVSLSLNSIKLVPIKRWRCPATLAVHRKLKWFIHLRSEGLNNGDEHPAYTPHRISHSTFLYNHIIAVRQVENSTLMAQQQQNTDRRKCSLYVGQHSSLCLMLLLLLLVLPVYGRRPLLKPGIHLWPAS